MPTSRAQEYFNELKGQVDLFAHLSSFVGSSEPVVETEWLDFKGCDHIDDRTTRSRWAESLSGFGNTEGGILIWGLDARKDPDTQIDRVTDLSLCEDVTRLEQILRQALHDACDPPIQGVEIISVPAHKGKEGFVVCFIPEGRHKPHRSEVGGKSFYIRVGDSFVIPNVSILRSMFYSKSSPYLLPLVRFLHETDGTLGVKMEFSIINEGTATADLVFLVLRHPGQFQFLLTQYGTVHPLARLYERIPINFVGPINPGLSVPFLALRAPNRHDLVGSGNENALVFEIQTFCRDTEPINWRCRVTHDDVNMEHSREFERAD